VLEEFEENLHKNTNLDENAFKHIGQNFKLRSSNTIQILVDYDSSGIKAT